MQLTPTTPESIFAERDVFVSSSIGRSQHFSVYDCDVEMLSPQDLEGEIQSEPEVHSACQMAHLSTVCRYPHLCSI